MRSTGRIELISGANQQNSRIKKRIAPANVCLIDSETPNKESELEPTEIDREIDRKSRNNLELESLTTLRIKSNFIRLQLSHDYPVRTGARKQARPAIGNTRI